MPVFLTKKISLAIKEGIESMDSSSDTTSVLSDLILKDEEEDYFSPKLLYEV